MSIDSTIAEAAAKTAIDDDLLLTAVEKNNADPVELAQIIREQFTPALLQHASEAWRKTGDTPFHRAALKNELKVMEILWQFLPHDLAYVGNNQLLPIHLAAFNGNWDLVKFFIENDPDMANVKDADLNRIEHWAAFGGHCEIVEKLLQFDGKSPDLANRNGFTLMHCAVDRGHLNLVSWLHLNNYSRLIYARTNKQDNEKMPIHLATLRGHLEIVRYFLEKCDQNLIYANDQNHLKPIDYAVTNGNVAMVAYLLPRHIEGVELRDDYFGRTLLHQATLIGHLDLIKALIRDFKADPYAKSGENDQFDLPIHLAAFQGHFEIVKFFVENWPDLGEAKDCQGNRPIHKAIYGGRVEIVEYLMMLQPNCNDEMRQESYGRTLLHSASAKGRFEIVKTLFEKYKVDIKATSNLVDYKVLPIHLAAYFGHLPIVDYFLQIDPSLGEAKDGQGNLPVHKAALGGQIKVVEYFVNRMTGFDIETRQQCYGRTLLHLAAEKGHLDLVQHLVEIHQADPFARSGSSDFEWLPIHLAAWEGNYDVACYFVNKFPQLGEAKDNLGRTPLYWAWQSGKFNEAPQVIDLLRSRNVKLAELDNPEIVCNLM